MVVGAQLWTNLNHDDHDDRGRIVDANIQHAIAFAKLMVKDRFSARFGEVVIREPATVVSWLHHVVPSGNQPHGWKIPQHSWRFPSLGKYPRFLWSMATIPRHGADQTGGYPQVQVQQKPSGRPKSSNQDKRAFPQLNAEEVRLKSMRLVVMFGTAG